MKEGTPSTSAPTRPSRRLGSVADGRLPGEESAPREAPTPASPSHRDTTDEDTVMSMPNPQLHGFQPGPGRTNQELAQYIEGHVARMANGRIRDLHVEYYPDRILLRGRSRTYHAKQVAHQAVLDLTDGHPLLANQIVVS